MIHALGALTADWKADRGDRYAGHFMDTRTGTFTIWLARPTLSEMAAIEAVVPGSFEVKTPQFTADELQRQLEAVARERGKNPDNGDEHVVHGYGIDRVANRVEVQVRLTTSPGQIEALESLGDAITVTRQSPMHTLSTASRSGAESATGEVAGSHGASPSPRE